MNWSVGTILVYETYSMWGRCKIERETPTTWVLNNGVRIKKGNRSPIGEHGYGKRDFYSIDEDRGKEIVERMERSNLIGWLHTANYSNVPTDKLKELMKYMESLGVKTK